ncbi:hypothetical protein SAMN05192575_102122 [Nocardioides alpinus]|uniref:Peptidase MA superfamily protein n=1 Tax=Nocardioides alpinus TaxID=748909 RepID=A0A1I0X497_9ACTN|nr:hypothetical protein [Nocardioides alpinus]PKH44108.1 hypothetical protein CXG46_00655 [Nocardioides alpinus]SFA95674.1 hypothetical protein SAMN05192575_102122 [Nocardioides alpinus]
MGAVVLTRGDRYEVAPRPADVPRASPAAAAAAVASFVDGVDARDAETLAGLAPAGDTDAEERLTSIARNADSLDLRGVTARYVDQVGTVAADGSWTGIVDLTWQFGGLDAEPSRADIAVAFAPDDDGLGVTGFRAAGTGRVPLWLRDELSVARADGVLVLVDGAPAEAEAVADRVARGIGVVSRVLTDWSSPVVVEVPASAADLDETLGAVPGTYASIAAVTTTAGSGTGPDAPVHVFVNPDVTAGLRRAGAQVVMSHELVHVATDAARTPIEPWLLEGFADYVALRDTHLPDRTTLGRAIEAARGDGVPTELPSAADFDTRAPDLQARYEEAWLACRIIAETLGEGALVETYAAAATGLSVVDALRRSGLSQRRLTQQWRTQLRALA